MSQNKAILIGRLGAALKLHYFNDGECIGRASLATSDKWTDKKGHTHESTQWHNLVFNNRIAETVEKYTDKGSQLFVEGKIKYREYEQDGVNRRITEIHVYGFEFLDKKPAPASDQARKVSDPATMDTLAQEETVQQARDIISEDKTEDKDDLPF